MSELVIAGRNVPRARSPGLWVLAWRRFGRDRVGVVSLVVVVFFCALMTASGLNLIAADWAQEAGVNYAPPTFMGPDAVEAVVTRTRRYAAYQRKWMRRVSGLELIAADGDPGGPAGEILARLVA